MIIEYSSMCMTVDNYEQKIDEASNFLAKQNLQFGIQIHNSISREMYEKLLPYRKFFPFTVHSPVLSDYFLNLASLDFDIIKSTADKAISFINETQSDLMFFHGFFMSKTPIVMDMKNYRKVIVESVGQKFTLNGSFIMNPKSFETQEFFDFCGFFADNYKKLKQYCESQGVIFALENDFVGVGSGLQRPQEILKYIDNLLFDIGHFWTSSIVHNFDYLELASEIIKSKNIVGAHIQRSLMPKNVELETIRDSHTHLLLDSQHPVREICRMLYDKGLQRFTLEIRDGNVDDIKFLLNSF